MTEQEKELQNGVELLLSLYLSLDLLEKYNAKKVLKNKINLTIQELERSILKHYNELFLNDEEFVQNSLKYKINAIKMLSKYNEADAVLACDFIKKFDNNIEVARKKGVIFFDKMYWEVRHIGRRCRGWINCLDL